MKFPLWSIFGKKQDDSSLLIAEIRRVEQVIGTMGISKRSKKFSLERPLFWVLKKIGSCFRHLWRAAREAPVEERGFVSLALGVVSVSVFVSTAWRGDVWYFVLPAFVSFLAMLSSIAALVCSIVEERFEIGWGSEKRRDIDELRNRVGG